MNSPNATSPPFACQADLVPQDRLNQLRISVIGVGAVGRQVALQLAAMGATYLQLIDFDTVESRNIVTQGYLAQDVGRNKVAATARAVREINPCSVVQVVADRYRPTLAVGSTVFCCVDSISSRNVIWRNLARHCEFWGDARMLGEIVRILTATDPLSRDHYSTTLFPQSEAEPGRCTAHGTIYTASLAAALLLHQFARWLRGLAPEPDLLLNLLANELTCLPVQDVLPASPH